MSLLDPTRLLVVLAALLPGAAAPGVTPTTVSIGSSGPVTGVLQGADAYFRYVNDRGGVNGRQIRFTYLDDGSDPVRTEENARELIEQDGVFALFSVVGTGGNLAIRDLANAAGVPQVFSAAGATTLGRDHARYPWTIGYPPPYGAEGALYAKQILALNPGAKIAVLYEDDADGQELLAGLRRGLGARAGQMVLAAIGYDPTAVSVEAEVAELRASGANTFMVFALGRFARQALVAARRLGWAPQVYADGVLAPPRPAVEGAVSLLWAGDSGLGAQIAKRYLPGADPRDPLLVVGMAEAYSFVDALRAAGRSPTRRSLLYAATHLNEASNPFLVPGVTVHTTPTWRFPVAAARLQRWHDGRWQPFGGVVSLKP